MKKLLLAFDAEKPDLQSLEFGIYLAQLTGSALTGVFLEDLPVAPPAAKFAYGSVYAESIRTETPPELTYKERIAEENIRKFKATCEAQGISYLVHRDQDVPLDELVAESRYADVIISGPALFAASPVETPAEMVKSLLNKAESPVIISPHRTYAIDKVLFAFDGSSSALFAIKQFTYLFPELSGTDINVLQADEGAIFNEEEKEKVYEYLKVHYSRIDFTDLRGKPQDELFDYCLRELNAILVMGAYGRSWLSNLFKASAADLVLKLNNLPVFITHR
ncbi:universal stress protein [Mucilaginibacter sp. AK015]|uniref:universal stress protein n=1 Tax=Mucilaginibacter sp. AK015 TaxID=2723072 RepID=UPI00160C71DC|nr:universal stress protein [Mucilaginibacter sp. AK015]MBB5396833.1 nucleotide-binding universal stress UspA family protein [Mucilaginibacter sp. AK015]